MKQLAMISMRTMTAKRSVWRFVLGLVTQLACFDDGNGLGRELSDGPLPAAEAGPSIVVDVSAPPRAMIVRASQDLAPLFPPEAELVGVAIDEFDGARYVLEARTGLYAITAAGAELVFGLPESAVARADGGDAQPPTELTDVAFHPWQSSEGSPSFAVTAENDGFALTSGGSVLHSFFCYFPTTSEWPSVAPQSVSQELRAQGIEIKERTHALAVHPSNGQIFAQPRTIRLDDGAVAGSELFVFAPEGGQPISTRRFEALEFAAGGMVVLYEFVLGLGYGSDLYIIAGPTAPVQRVATLEGVTIEGLAFIPNGNLLVLDGPGKRLLEVDAEHLRDLINGSSPLGSDG